MGKPVNSFLARRDAQIEHCYMQKLQISSEIDLLAMMLMMSDDLQVGPGRAQKCLNDMLAYKIDIAEKIISDSTEDPEILVLKRDLAYKMRQIFGKSWEAVKTIFPLLKIYWEG